ncbi:ABC transporter [Rahnella aceris]|uniref:ABC transporter n=1 Tax=Rahnella sp. (strain Y9602) TaxID=2703885 RepID=UPI001C26FE31|nr:ABC transporter [Rahnella aceris]MBU9849023.1 ABC transporter [Rahnella aceris]
MRFIPVWIYMQSLFIFSKIERQGFIILMRAIKQARRVLQLIPLRVIFTVLHVFRILGLTSKHQKSLSLVANENKRCLTGDDSKIEFTWTAQRRKALDYAATYGRNQQVISQLDACAAELNKVVMPLHQTKTPVILAPLHMVSDILAGIVASKTCPGKGTVIVSANAEHYIEQDRLRGGINLTYCSIHNQSHDVANNIISSCMEAAENKTNIIIFPDITPDYTLATDSACASKLKCRLFDRPAKLHNGVLRLAKMISADVVFYYLYYDQGIKIRIFPVVRANDVAEKMPKIIEHAIKAHPQDWLLWHLHSLYFINE